MRPPVCCVVSHDPFLFCVASVLLSLLLSFSAPQFDKSLIAGAGAFEIAAHRHLLKVMEKVDGRAKIGVRAFAEALLVIPKTLASNSGLDAQSVLIDVMDEQRANPDAKVGVDLATGKACLPERVGIWDNYCVKKQFIHLGYATHAHAHAYAYVFA